MHKRSNSFVPRVYHVLYAYSLTDHTWKCHFDSNYLNFQVCDLFTSLLRKHWYPEIACTTLSSISSNQPEFQGKDIVPNEGLCSKSSKFLWARKRGVYFDYWEPRTPFKPEKCLQSVKEMLKWNRITILNSECPYPPNFEICWGIKQSINWTEWSPKHKEGILSHLCNRLAVGTEIEGDVTPETIHSRGDLWCQNWTRISV